MKTKTVGHSSAQIRKKIAAIEELHSLGRQSQATRPGFGRAGEHAKEAKKKRVGEDHLRKARRFADAHGGYAKRDLHVLYVLFRQHRFALGPECLVRLLSMHNNEERRRLTRLAVRQRWPSRRLELEIAMRFGSRRAAGGRQPTVPVDTVGALAEIRRTAATMRRRYTALASNGGPTLPRPLRQKLAGVIEQLHELETMAGRGLRSKRAVGHDLAAGAK